MSSGNAAKAEPPIRRFVDAHARFGKLLRRGDALEAVYAKNRQFQQHRRSDQKIDRAQRHRQADGDDRT